MLLEKMCQEKKKNECINSHISRQVFVRASETEINRERGSKEVVQVHHKARLSRGALQGFRCGALAEKINDRTNRKSSARKKVACPRQIANACVQEIYEGLRDDCSPKLFLEEGNLLLKLPTRIKNIQLLIDYKPFDLFFYANVHSPSYDV